MFTLRRAKWVHIVKNCITRNKNVNAAGKALPFLLLAWQTLSPGDGRFLFHLQWWAPHQRADLCASGARSARSPSIYTRRSGEEKATRIPAPSSPWWLLDSPRFLPSKANSLTCQLSKSTEKLVLLSWSVRSCPLKWSNRGGPSACQVPYLSTNEELSHVRRLSPTLSRS